MNQKSEDKQLMKSTQTPVVGNSTDCYLEKITFLKKEQIKIKDIPKDEKFRIILGATLTEVYNLAGLKGSIDDINKRDIKQLLITRFKSLSIPDIYYAFKNERYGVYDAKTSHYGLFNAEYVSDILKKYQNWKIEQIKTHNIKKEKILTEKKPIDKIKILENGVQRVCLEYLSTGKIELKEPQIYDYLDSKGEMPKCNEYKNKIMKKAKEIAKTEQKKDIIRKMRKNLTKTSKEYIVLIAKNLCLMDYFDKKLKNTHNKGN